MSDAVGTILALAFGVTCLGWCLVHATFWRLLREDRPVLAEKCRGFEGMQPRWLDFALRRGYRGAGSARLERAGDRLVAWNSFFKIAFVAFFLAGACIVAFGWLFASN